MASSPAVARAHLDFAREFVQGRDVVAAEEMARRRRAGYTDRQVGEIATDVALNLFTNDFPAAADVAV